MGITLSAASRTPSSSDDEIEIEIAFVPDLILDGLERRRVAAA